MSVPTSTVRWIDKATVVDVTGLAERTVEEKAHRGEFKTRPTAKRHPGNGKLVHEYDVMSLPAKAQIALLDRLARGAAIVPVTAEKKDNVADPPKPERRRGDVAQAERGDVEKWKTQLAPLVEWKLRGKRGGRRTYSKLLAVAAANMPCDRKTVKRKLRDYIKYGEVGLLRKVRNDEGESRWFRSRPRCGAFALQKAIRENLSDVSTWFALKRELAALGEGDKICSLGALSFFLKRKVPEHIRFYAREGEREFHRVAQVTAKRDITRMRAGEWTILDSRCLDIFVRNTTLPREVMEFQKMFRPWITVALDWASWCVIGLGYAPTPSSRTINTCLRMMASKFGLSPNLYWDHGKDFQKVGRDIMDDQIAGILNQHRVAITNALPYNARSKPIEPFFQIVARRFDPLWGAAYSGRRPDLCSAKCRDAQKAHKLFVEGKARETPLPEFMQVGMSIAQFFEEYNQQPNRRLNGRSPKEVYEEQCPPESRRMVDPRTLDQLFWQRDKRTLLQGGCIELNNLRYEPTDASFAVLSAKWKQEVIVARDPYDFRTAIAFDASNREFLGELQIQQLAMQSPHGLLSVEAMKATARRRAKLLRSARDYVALVGCTSQANGLKSEADSLLDRAGVLGTGTDGRVISRNSLGTAALHASREQRQLAPSPFVSDSVKSLLEMSEDE